MTTKTTLNPVIAAGISTTFQRPSAFARVAQVSAYQLGRMLDGASCPVGDVRRVEHVWAVLDPFKLRGLIDGLSTSSAGGSSTVDRVAISKLLAALDMTYEALTGVELITTTSTTSGGD